VAEVMKPDGSHLAGGPELHPAARAAAQGIVLCGLEVAATLTPALVVPRLHYFWSGRRSHIRRDDRSC
jgi:hypothetical protein